MKKSIVVAAVILVAVAAGGLFLKRHPSDEQPVQTGGKDVVPETPPARVQQAPVAEHDAASSPKREAPLPKPSDPRLAALAISQDNGLIEFVPGSDGRVIKELDKDPNSFGFRKPLREYTYRGDQVIGLTSYQYFSDHVQVTRTTVSYKPDGTVDQYLESTSDDYGERKK